jgi:hypothetical protein
MPRPLTGGGQRGQDLPAQGRAKDRGGVCIGRLRPTQGPLLCSQLKPPLADRGRPCQEAAAPVQASLRHEAVDGGGGGHVEDAVHVIQYIVILFIRTSAAT